MPTEPIGREAFLGIGFDRLTLRGVVAALAAADSRARLRYVVTPNVDHVVRCLEPRHPADARLAAIYAAADWCLCDSRVLARLALLTGRRLSVVPGSDLTAALLDEVVKPGDRIAVVGGDVDMAPRLRQRFPGVTFLQHRPPMGLRDSAAAIAEAAAFVEHSDARFSFLVVGAPQQELIAAELTARGRASGVALCVGASLEFVIGAQRRAPRLVQRMGLEWLHRLLTHPRRLWRRYLVEGPRILLLLARR